jgi:hypothetical protein
LFEALPRGAGQTLLTQTAYLAPKGLSGLAYWYGLYPVHGLIFGNMIRAIGERAKACAGQRSEPGIARRLQAGARFPLKLGVLEPRGAKER